MSKILDKVIEEMGGYGDMGLPDGESAMGMGSVSPMGMRGGRVGKDKLKAYRLSDILRHRTQAEEEEDLDAVDTEMDIEDDGVEEIKQFFLDNSEPSDEDIEMYAEEHGMDMDDMRKAVYRLIRSLLGTEEPSDEAPVDDMDMGSEMSDDDEIDFSAKI